MPDWKSSRPTAWVLSWLFHSIDAETPSRSASSRRRHSVVRAFVVADCWGRRHDRSQSWCIAVLPQSGHHGDVTGFHGYVGLQARGLIALPTELRRRMHLDEPGAQVEILEREDGVLELRAALPVPAEQAWFWTERAQQREREVDDHVTRGEVTMHDSTDDFLTHLDKLDAATADS